MSTVLDPAAFSRSVREASREPMTRSQVERAIFLDFEGNQNVPPTFAGTLTEDSFGQTTFEAVFRTAAVDGNAKPHLPPQNYAPLGSPAAGLKPSLRHADRREFAQVLLERARSEGRFIVSWSTHDAEKLLELVPEAASELAAVVRDGRISAKGWLRKTRPDVVLERAPGVGKHRLKKYLAVIGYALPSYFGERQAAQRITFVRNALLRQAGNYQDITPVAKAKWTKVLDYNWHDSFGLRELMMHVTSADTRHACVAVSNR